MSKFHAGLRPTPKTGKVQPLSFKKGNNVCNICRRKSNLTDDHIPPRCCGNDKEISARRIYAEELIAPQVDAKSRNGLKFRTLCKRCNGDLLGAWDGAVGELADQAARIVQPLIALPTTVPIAVRSGAILRSFLGHVVACKVQDDAVPIDQRIRDYLMGLAPLPASIKAYCWLYPFSPTVVSRDFTFVVAEGEGGSSPGIVSVVKFFPLAFCVLDGQGSLNGNGITELHQFASMEPSDTAAIHLHRAPIVQPGWPERALGNHIVLGGRTYADSVTTVGEEAAIVRPGRRTQTIRWEARDSEVFKDLHAFAEIADPPQQPSR
jgi:hypothetical protein